MGMHFKLGLYEHQSAGALHGLIELCQKHPQVTQQGIKSIKVIAYEPAFGIIGDPAKRNPTTRQSADHSMVFILSRKFQKAIALAKAGALGNDLDSMWKNLILTPADFSQKALSDPKTRELMAKIEFEHGGKEYDDNYPDGIPTSLVITTDDNKQYSSGFIMYPAGHARNTTAD